MRLVSAQIFTDTNIITDLDTGEKIDISSMGLRQMEELQHQVNLNEEDFQKLQIGIVNQKVGFADFYRDLQREMIR